MRSKIIEFAQSFQIEGGLPTVQNMLTVVEEYIFQKMGVRVVIDLNLDSNRELDLLIRMYKIVNIDYHHGINYIDIQP